MTAPFGGLVHLCVCPKSEFVFPSCREQLNMTPHIMIRLIIDN